MLGGSCSPCCLRCVDCKPSSVRVTLNSNNLLRHVEWKETVAPSEDFSDVKQSYAIIGSALSETFDLSLVRSSDTNRFDPMGTYFREFESQELQYPSSGKVSAAFYKTSGGRWLAIRAPLTVCIATNYRIPGFEYKHFSIDEMVPYKTLSSISRDYEEYRNNRLWLRVRVFVGNVSIVFQCVDRPGQNGIYVATASESYDSGAQATQEGFPDDQPIPCTAWLFDALNGAGTTTARPEESRYYSVGYLDFSQRFKNFVVHRSIAIEGYNQVASNNVITGNNSVRILQLEYDCGE